MNRTIIGSVVLLLNIALVSTASGQSRNTARNAPPPVPSPAPAPGSLTSQLVPGTNKESPAYVIQPNDVLRIFVWKDDALTQPKTLVRPDGRISLPLVQDIQAAGLTPGQLKQKLEERLKDWVDVPNVTVIVDTIQSYEVYVMGNVATPGVVRNTSPLTVMQVLGTVGGFKEFADRQNVLIIRGKDRMKFNFEDYIKGRFSNDNITLQSGDVIWVP